MKEKGFGREVFQKAIAAGQEIYFKDDWAFGPGRGVAFRYDGKVQQLYCKRQGGAENQVESAGNELACQAQLNGDLIGKAEYEKY
jgi:hypothetical protein